MIVFNAFIFLTCVSVAIATAGGFTYTNCHPGESPINLESIRISPSPIELPGNITLSVRGNLTRSVASASLSIRIKRDTFLINVPLPCIDHVGSCTFPDLCTIVEDMITHNWAGIMGPIGSQIKTMLLSAGIDPTQCPIGPVGLDINSYTLTLPKPPAILNMLAAGTYEAHVEVKENGSNQMLLCLDIMVDVVEHKDPCTGWLCGGRKRRLAAKQKAANLN